MGKCALKIKMTFEEMAEVFSYEHPELIPNKSNVGRFAKKLGYRLIKQTVNYKQIYSYFNPQFKNHD